MKETFLKINQHLCTSFTYSPTHLLRQCFYFEKIFSIVKKSWKKSSIHFCFSTFAVDIIQCLCVLIFIFSDSTRHKPCGTTEIILTDSSWNQLPQMTTGRVRKKEFYNPLHQLLILLPHPTVFHPFIQTAGAGPRAFNQTHDLTRAGSFSVRASESICFHFKN